MTAATGHDAGSAGAGPARGVRLVAVYSLLRLALLLGVTAVLLGIGLALVAATGHAVTWRTTRPILLAAAFVGAPLSMLASFRLLAGYREAMAGQVAAGVERYRQRAAARTAREDAYAEELRRSAGSEPPSGERPAPSDGEAGHTDGSG